jgi:hypothetical protein
MKSAESLPAAVPVYDEMLKRDWSWAIDEGDRFFQQEDAVFKSLRKKKVPRAVARRQRFSGWPG